MFLIISVLACATAGAAPGVVEPAGSGVESAAPAEVSVSTGGRAKGPGVPRDGSLCTELIRRPASYGIGIDMDGNVWVSGHTDFTLYKYSPDAQNVDVFENVLQSANRGVAVTPVDNHVWVAHTGFDCTDNRVSRFSNDGALCETVSLGYQAGYGPSAVAVDGDGYVWVTCMQQGSGAVWRIHPGTDPPAPCGSGTDPSVVDGSVDLDYLDGGVPHPLESAEPYNYSDMTGMVTLQTSATWTWSMVHDGGVYGARWSRVTWNTEPTCRIWSIKAVG